MVTESFLGSDTGAGLGLGNPDSSLSLFRGFSYCVGQLHKPRVKNISMS